MTRRRRKPLPIVLSWLSAVLVLSIVVVGWWTGRPLSPELMGVIGAFWLFTVGTDVAWTRSLSERDTAIKELAVRKGVQDEKVETVYALVEAEVEDERRRQRALDRSRR